MTVTRFAPSPTGYIHIGNLRAIAQLKVCGELDPSAAPMAQTYREGIICEVYREKVLAGEKEPLIFGEPEEWIALMIEALKLQAAGNFEQAEAVRAKAFDAAPSVSGELNGEPFEWIADAERKLLVDDVTTSLGGVVDEEPIRFMSNHPDAYRQLADEDNLRAIEAIEARLNRGGRPYVPEDRIADISSQFTSRDAFLS